MPIERFARNVALRQPCKPIPLRLPQHAGAKPRRIEGEHPGDAARGFVIAHRGRIHRKIASLGVPSDIQPFRQAARRGFEIAHGTFLRRHAIHVRHVEILPPTGKRAVRAAEPHEGEFVSVCERQCRELGVLLFVEHACAFADLHIAKTRACRQREHERLDLVGNHAREHVAVMLGEQGVFEPHAAARQQRPKARGRPSSQRFLVAHRRQHIFHAHHAELGKHQRIDGAKRNLVERGEFRRQIVHDGAHAPAPFLAPHPTRHRMPRPPCFRRIASRCEIIPPKADAARRGTEAKRSRKPMGPSS